MAAFCKFTPSHVNFNDHGTCLRACARASIDGSMHSCMQMRASAQVSRLHDSACAAAFSVGTYVRSSRACVRAVALAHASIEGRGGGLRGVLCARAR
eukprot:1929463-Pleurochrysis_carterae.AAC.2